MTTEPNPTGLGGVARLEERYRLLSRLGAGGMAEVFLAVQLGESSFKRLVVIKRIHSLGSQYANALSMFIDEARTVATLNHPHIVKLYDLSRLQGDVCIAMEYVDGEDLYKLCHALRQSGQRFPLPIACKLMIEACEALHYAHAARTPAGKPLHLVHRDIGPQNLLLDSNGYLKIIDFGIAKTDVQSQFTNPDQLKGRLSYIPPEAYLQQELDGRADLYALGLVFFELVTLRKAFDVPARSEPVAVMTTVLTQAVPAPSTLEAELPEALDPIIARATHKKPSQRYQSGEEMAAAIRSFAAAHGGLATTAEVQRWFAQNFQPYIQRRRQLERQAMELAADLHRQDVQGTSSAVTPSAPLEVVALQQADTQPERGRRARVAVNPYVFVTLLFVLIAAVAVLFQQLFFTPSTAPPVAVAVAPTTPAPAPPPVLPTRVDAGQSPAAARPDDEESTELAAPTANKLQPASKGRARPRRAEPPQHAPPSTAPTAAQPTPTAVDTVPPTASTAPPTPTPAPTPQAQPAPTGTAAPAGTSTADAAARWYSGDGSWSGAQVAGQGCTRCHDGAQASKLSWSSKTRRQWSHFFRRRRHRRHGELGDHFSAAELQRVERYILAQIRDDSTSGIAGVK